MSIKNNTTSLQEVLDILATKASGTNTSDATATAEEIFQGKTAYASEGKVMGTFTIENELATQNDLIAQIQNAVDNLPDAGSSSYETCTVNISSDGGTFGDVSGTIVYNTLENGTLKVQRINGATNSLSIQAVCGSFLLVNESVGRMDHSFTGLEMVSVGDYSFFADNGCYCFRVTAAANTTATLTIEID